MELIQARCGRIAHRGPDDSGAWRSDSGYVALGHQRLSIIDLTPGGHQPMSDAEAGIRIIFNGEIYNYLDLRKELEDLGVVFRSASDTEVFLAAYRVWGDACLDRLNGMFAAAIVDERRQRVLLTRDRAGEKPLYYQINDGTLRFASEIKGLPFDEGAKLTMNAEALESYLAYGYAMGDVCLVDGVKKLRPATALSFDLSSGTHRVWKYWTLPDQHPAPMVNSEMLTDELETLLTDAVARQLVADVPVGILLSGGVDSSVITALAARAASDGIRTFTVTFQGHPEYDESQFARQVANHVGTEHVELQAEAATVDLLPMLARQFDDPIGDSSMVPTFIVSRLIRAHATVALGGDGGDELFGGYRQHSWVYTQAQLRARVPPIVRRAMSAAGSRLPVGVRGRNHLIGAAEDVGNAIAHFNLLFDGRTRDRLLAGGAGRCTRRWPENYKRSLCISSRSASRRTMCVDFQTYLCDDILTKVDRASMLTSLEVRAPYLDHRVIAFAFGRIPDELRATVDERKVLLRSLASRLLPPSLDLRRKQGFSIPLSAWFKGEWGTFMSTVLRDAPPALFVPSAIDKLIRGQRKGRANAQRLFALTMLELWRREYQVAPPP